MLLSDIAKIYSYRYGYPQQLKEHFRLVLASCENVKPRGCVRIFLP